MQKVELNFNVVNDEKPHRLNALNRSVSHHLIEKNSCKI